MTTGAVRLGAVGVVWVLAASAALAQGTVAATAGGSGAQRVGSRRAGIGGSRIVPIEFVQSERPVLGMAEDVPVMDAACSDDGVTYVPGPMSGPGDAGLDGGRAPVLLAISDNGDVKTITRRMPRDARDVDVLDFFPAGTDLVTLLRGEERDAGEDKTAPARSVRYYISTSDHDGDHAGLVTVGVRFRPMKVAAFGSGDLVVLGWDEVNDGPEMALVKPDGDVRRFLEYQPRRLDRVEEGEAGLRRAEAAARLAAERATREVIEGAKFAPFGGSLLLFYPGTTKGIRVLTAAGAESVIPVQHPAGWVLRGVVNAGAQYTVVLRLAQESSPAAKADEKTAAGQGASGAAGADAPAGGTKKAAEVREEIVEVNVRSGAVVKQFTLGKVKASEVSCAAGGKLMAIFRDTLQGASGMGAVKAPEVRVVSSVLR